MTPDDLVAVEEIKQLKARYFRFMDLKRWDDYAGLFTDDAVMRFGPAPTDVVRGRDTLVAHVRTALAHAVTVHQGHMPEIEIRGDSASGVWAMFDHTDSAWDYSDRKPAPRPGKDALCRYVKEGYGHYTDEYRREADGRWQIASTTLTRLRVDRLPAS